MSKSKQKGKMTQVRIVDDMCFAFKFYSQAVKYYKVLRNRLTKYDLELHDDKSKLLPFGSRADVWGHVAGPTSC